MNTQTAERLLPVLLLAAFAVAPLSTAQAYQGEEVAYGIEVCTGNSTDSAPIVTLTSGEVATNPHTLDNSKGNYHTNKCDFFVISGADVSDVGLPNKITFKAGGEDGWSVKPSVTVYYYVKSKGNIEAWARKANNKNKRAAVDKLAKKEGVQLKGTVFFRAPRYGFLSTEEETYKGNPYVESFEITAPHIPRFTKIVGHWNLISECKTDPGAKPCEINHTYTVGVTRGTTRGETDTWTQSLQIAIEGSAGVEGVASAKSTVTAGVSHSNSKSIARSFTTAKAEKTANTCTGRSLWQYVYETTQHSGAVTEARSVHTYCSMGDDKPEYIP